MTPFNNSTSLEYRVALLCILALGIALRVYAWYAGEGYLYYAINDEMLAYRYALGFLAGEQHTFYLGQPAFAAGQAPGPMWTLFWVALLKLGNDSVHYALLWMALFNSTAIYIFYRLARHFVPANLTLFATLFFAVAPWPIYYSVGMWNPLPLVVIGSLLFLALWNVLNQENSRQIFWICVLAAVIPQFHMIGIFYLPAILFLLFISKNSLSKKWFVLGICAGLAVYLPYLIGEFNHGFTNTRSMLAGGDKPSLGVLKVLSAPLTMITSIPAGWAGRDFAATTTYASNWFGSFYVLLVFCLLSLAYAGSAYLHFFKRTFVLIKQSGSRPRAALARDPQLIFLASLIIIPLAFFVLTRHDYATRYTLLIFPLLFLMPVLFYQVINKIATRRIFIACTVVIFCFNVYLTLTYFHYQGEIIHQNSKFSPSFRSLEKLAEDLYNKIEKNKRIRIVLADDIQTLPEGERKIAVALTQYFEIIDHYKLERETPTEYVHIRMTSDISKSLLPANHILHRANGMIFTLQ